MTCITFSPLNGTEVNVLTSGPCLWDQCFGLCSVMLVHLLLEADKNENTFKLESRDFSLNLNRLFKSVLLVILFY